MHNLNSENFDTETFQKFARYILKKTGIVVNENKKSHLSNRLRGRIKQLKLKSFGDYWDYLMHNESDNDELHIFFDAVSTNETYFQRGTSHFKILENYVLPDLYKNNIHNVNIWSCGTSTGEEAYDLGMIAIEFEKKHPDMDIYITGTDISNKTLQMARNGEYSDRRIDKLSSYQLENYFDSMEPEDSKIPFARNVIKVKNNLKQKVVFKYLNLVSDSYLSNVDIIFCRNVMIYFNRETQIDLIENFNRCLNNGGYLFIGPAESLQLVPNSFSIIKTEYGNVYKKSS